MKIWAQTVFKNEARWLWYSATSVIDYVDKLLLWDTGSTDSSYQIAKLLKEKYKDKIDLKEYGQVTKETFTQVRQDMLDRTEADWFLVVDADEIWWQDSIEKLINRIQEKPKGVESIVVPTVNLIGDIYHYQDESLGRYKFGNLKGHYNLRAVKRDIPGLCSRGVHGVWGWADEEGKQIQDRNTFEFVDAKYLHATFIPRASSLDDEAKVPKRSQKLKYEIGNEFPKDYFYPESLFKDKPGIVPSPWSVMPNSYFLRSLIETPLKKLKRKFKNEKIGY